MKSNLLDQPTHLCMNLKTDIGGYVSRKREEKGFFVVVVGGGVEGVWFLKGLVVVQTDDGDSLTKLSASSMGSATVQSLG